ncbi:hypothetical protein [Methanosarcina mazei]|uniref:hypothetical protein n=1 Tax=Methanosarcina mazei TaxID=2209 RepID=UPI0012D383AB|nr:hypothetical protein [Methanosarcina mazei]
MKRTADSRGAIREGQRTPEAQFGKDSGLPRRNSGRTVDSRGAIREGQRTPEAQFGKDSGLPRRNSGRTVDSRGAIRGVKKTSCCCTYSSTHRKPAIYFDPETQPGRSTI